MKVFAILLAAFAAIYYSRAEATNSLEQFSPDFPSRTEIVWRAPTNNLPSTFWIYRRSPPRAFSEGVISNAVALASLQGCEIPKPSTNAFFIWSEPNPCGVRFSTFSIQPASATIAYSPNHQNCSTGNIPDGETVTKLAFDCAARLGLDQAQLKAKKVYQGLSGGGCGETSTKNACTRGVLLFRQLDGFSFFGDKNDGVEGLAIEFGRCGQISAFSLVWPTLAPERKCSTASPDEIIRCIRARRVLVIPVDNEPNFFRRINNLTNATDFTITKIAPYYGEGVFGCAPTSDEPPQVIAPFAELEAVADFGKSNMTLRLLSPILSSEVTRLLGRK